jgi:hypothetical protein
VHDAEYQHDAVPVDHVVHDPMVADPQPVERVACSLDRLDRLAPDPAAFRRIGGELLQGLPDPPLEVGRELLEGANGCRRQLDAVGAQSRSSRLVERPFA